MAKITYVDHGDTIIGYGTKEEAIAKGLVHRIARVFILNSEGEILIQKRSDKATIPGRWDQSAAGHVDEGEDYLTAAARETREEVGIERVDLTEVGKYYSEELDDGLLKKRYTTLFTGVFDGERLEGDGEVSDVMWIPPLALKSWMNDKPEDFTQGFIQCYDYFERKLQEAIS
jgi:16S rRNA (adenine1518-N6/adenine1519-N6)-dimethyltransferase